ncbi:MULTISPECIES: DUF7695 domain-containing protein [Eubacterium]|uniref:DUF7695 domain-containing protein n=1 Tax=Eubacterium ruminantium TaxID=42322 RepID=A0A1T4L7Z3_9FIRM|nr:MULTISPECIES: hypothetical protein [Eubacterium]SCW43983.1 hypothetical protein SAMN05660484_01039 [Eubacterium ruminantium]SDM78271.1 hypothetical protein SAMN04490370_10689 [Eubacterium ruminantium]SJZ50784.1 hypothetical protein SAMN02745110_00719 [Eubacterium ruminantium]
MRRIIANKAQCRKCNDIIESKVRTQRVKCSCGSIWVDGGKYYIKRGFKESKDDIIELSEFDGE